MENINRWQIKPLIYTHLFIFLLAFCYIVPPLRSVVIQFDIKMAYLINSLGKMGFFWQNFWAFFNSPGADWLYDFVMLFFILGYIFHKDEKTKSLKTLHIIYIVLLTIFSYLVINRIFFGKIIHPRRISPTGPLEDLFRLSSVVKWVKIKEYATSTFPADHASTVFMFVISQFHLRGKKWGFYASIASLPFILPRMIAGAHWWSDLFMGSLPIALINQAWLFYTPAFSYLTEKCRWFYGNKQTRKSIQ